MQRIPVDSSNLASVGYNAGTNILEVEFHDGGVYQYEGVPDSIYHALIGDNSKGSYFYRNIRNRYRTTKVQ